MSKTVGEIYGISIKPYKPTSTDVTIFKKLKISDQNYSKPWNIFMGLEIETENVRFRDSEFMQLSGWRTTADNSLRNNGIEWVSFPAETQLLGNLIDYFYDHIAPQVEFTPRTSIHVHCNLIPFNHKQVDNLIKMYLLLEKALYNFAGKDRDKSIFCVPLCEGGLSFNPSINLENDHAIVNISERWNKYCGLNFTRLHDIGTAEFRHLPGENDKEKLVRWITILQSLVQRAYSMDQSALWANIVNDPRRLMSMILSEEAIAYLEPFNLLDSILNGISTIKAHSDKLTFKKELDSFKKKVKKEAPNYEGMQFASIPSGVLTQQTTFEWRAAQPQQTEEQRARLNAAIAHLAENQARRRTNNPR